MNETKKGNKMTKTQMTKLIKAIEQRAKEHFPDVIASKQGLKINF